MFLDIEMFHRKQKISAPKEIGTRPSATSSSHSAVSAAPSDAKKIEPLSFEKFEEFGVAVEESSITPLARRRSAEKTRSQKIRSGAVELAKELVSDIEHSFESMVDASFSVGKASIRIYSEPGLSSEQLAHDIDEMRQNPNLISDPSVKSLLGKNKNEMTVFIGEGFSLFDDYRQFAVIFDESPITRAWFIECVMAHLCTHLTQAGYSLPDMTMKNRGSVAYPEAILEVSWAPELDDEEDVPSCEWEIGGYRIGDVLVEYDDCR